MFSYKKERFTGIVKVYVNESCEICAVRKTDRTDLMEFEIDLGSADNSCDAALFGYKYEPIFVKDENDDFILDENGDKIIIGNSFYPFIDYHIIQFIQRLYEEEQAALISIAESTVDNDYRLSMLELGLKKEREDEIMTYRNFKKLIEIAERKAIKTEEWVAGMKGKLDILLLNNRITDEGYTELMRLLEPMETPEEVV